ncbi:DNA cytosine methyltransferase [Anaeroselena agilis]|uniref:DNA (cytosine-5-)-methyltransferase n=1 Tax=Anaeroselena agilis TaxID=3063788 RepID=A0ABU3NYH9_9FIRM|nr:DNA cytosine methyltransferase [Selenomonadales bacterium 4137-cl]
MMNRYKALHLFCGSGGAAVGMQESVGEYKGAVAKFTTLAGIDCDPLCCEDFEYLTDAPAVRMDLFNRADYIAFHGKEPPEDWREVTPYDLYRAAGDYPDVVFLSPPCKGFSGLLPSKSAASDKYQALNRLVVRSMGLTMRAFEEDLPAFILIENVPMIKTRGAFLVKQVKKILGRYGYVFHGGDHDCGELGGLGQRRKRFLLVARNEAKVPAYLYQPPKLKLRTIGDIIGPIPLPDAPSCGPMHRLPRLQWKTWVRLALIPAGGDWRDLQKIAPEQYRLEHIPRSSTMGVMDWQGPSGTVTGNTSIGGSTPAAVSDPRLNERESRHPSVYRVIKFDETAPCITGTRFGSGAPAVADPRLDIKDGHAALYQVGKWDAAAKTVTGAAGPNNGALSVGDPRLDPKSPKFNHAYTVTGWDGPAGTVAGGTGPSCGGHVIADPRVNIKSTNGRDRTNLYNVQAFDASATTVTGGTGPSSGGHCIADPRLAREKGYHNMFQLGEWDKPATCVTGIPDIQSGAQSIADPRVQHAAGYYNHSYSVTPWDTPSGTITSGHSPSCGGHTIADPRLGNNIRNGALGVHAWDKPGSTILAAGDVHAGASSIADPRFECDMYPASYGVQNWNEPAVTVRGNMRTMCSPASVADPRIPGDKESGVWVIIAEDGTWHRPLTTLELAALQGFPLTVNGKPLVLAGKSDARWREAIGNAVPPPAARAIGDQILTCLLASEKGDYFDLTAGGVWVREDGPTEVEVIVSKAGFIHR